MSPSDWATISDALRILSPVLGGWAIYLLRQILSQLRTLNGRMTKVEAWQTSHDSLDDERFDAIHREIDQVRHARPARA